MFCPKCGTAIADGSTFCMNCGKQIAAAEPTYVQNPYEAQAQQYKMMKDATRKGEQDSLSEAISHFSLKSAQFKEYDEVCENVNKYGRGAKSALIVWGAIISTFGMIAMAVMSSAETNLEAVAGAILIPGLLMVIGGILMKVNNRRRYGQYLERYEQLSRELYSHYLSCSNCPVGPEYANPEVLAILYRILQSGRVDTVREAINMLVASADRGDMEDYLEDIRRNAENVDAHNRVPAFFLPAELFK